MSEPVFIPNTGELTGAEKKLVVRACSGTPVDLNGQSVDASVLGDLLSGARKDWVVGAGRLKLANAVVIGGVDLAGARITAELLFDNVRFEGRSDRAALNLCDAKVARLVARRCTFEAAFDATGVEVDGDLVVTECTLARGLLISEARVGGGLCLAASSIAPGNLPDVAPAGAEQADRAAGETNVGPDEAARPAAALNARAIQVGGETMLDGLVSGGDLVFQGGRLSSGLSIQGIEVLDETAACRFGGVLVGRDVSGADSRFGERLDLAHAHIGGSLRLVGAKAGAGGLCCQNVRVGGLTDFDGVQVKGPVGFNEACLDAGLRMGSANIESAHEAVGLNGALVRRDVLIEGCKLVGEVHCRDLKVERHLSFSRSRCHGGLLSVIGRGLSCGGRFDFSSVVCFGKVVLSGMRSGGTANFDGATVKVAEGAAIRLDEIDCGGDLSFRHGSHCAGGLVAHRARIKGDVAIEGAEFVSSLIARKGKRVEPAALLAESTHAEDAASLQSAAERLETSEFDDIAFGFSRGRCRRLVMAASDETRGLRGIVDLSHAEVDLLIDDPALWPPGHGERFSDETGEAVEGLILDGLVYAGLQTVSANANDEVARSGRFARGSLDAGLPERLIWLDGQPQRDLHAGLKRQPWRQLSGYYRREGRDQDADIIELALRRLAAASPAVSPRRRLMLWLYDVFCEFGTNAYRPLGWIVLAWLVLGSAVWGVHAVCNPGACGPQAAFTIAAHPEPGVSTGRLVELQPFIYAADRLLAFADFGQAQRYRPNPQWLFAPEHDRAQKESAPPGGTGAAWPWPVSAGTLMAVFETIIQLFCGLMLILFAGCALRAVSERGRRGP